MTSSAVLRVGGKTPLNWLSFCNLEVDQKGIVNLRSPRCSVKLYARGNQQACKKFNSRNLKQLTGVMWFVLGDRVSLLAAWLCVLCNISMLRISNGHNPSSLHNWSYLYVLNNATEVSSDLYLPICHNLQCILTKKCYF